MNICVNCKQEMKCKKTGKSAVWNKTHCYSGDEFECLICGATVLICREESFHCNDIKKFRDEKSILDMTGDLYDND